MKKIHIDIDNEFVDSFISKIIQQHLKMNEADIRKLESLKKLDRSQKEDLDYYKKLLAALKVVGEYFGACDEYGNIIKDDNE